MAGVQNAIDEYDATPGLDQLPTVAELFEDRAVTMYLDSEGSEYWGLFGPGPHALLRRASGRGLALVHVGRRLGGSRLVPAGQRADGQR